MFGIFWLYYLSLTLLLFLCLARVDPCEDLNCTEDEWCGKKDGIYGCFCNENHPRPNPDTCGKKTKNQIHCHGTKSHNYLTPTSLLWLTSFFSQTLFRSVRAARALCLYPAVSCLKLVFLLVPCTWISPAALEQSKMAEWSSTLIMMNTSVAPISWYT